MVCNSAASKRDKANQAFQYLASTSDNPGKKTKKLIGQDGKPLDSGAAAAALADGSNKTRTGRFKRASTSSLIYWYYQY